ncbi:polyketide synthase dehydratase domain-containing protein, partial [Streptomyces sp. NPDC020996]|uniref:polyketide synthase dehydratase domain-containing protein n=1 Tax=Streptomyces sp. NPDC020996 TaxID=3154791 RepID=UPI0033CAA3AF
GAKVDWQALLAGYDAARVDLPTYAFQRERYWLDIAPTGAGDVTAAGLAAADHPLLGAAVRLAEGDQVVLTGRLSLRTHPWLADHAVSGTVLLPGTAFVELAVRAGDETGCTTLDELTLEAPLVLPAEGGVRLQTVVGAAAADGRRPVALYSLPEDTAEAAAEAAAEGAAGGTPWTRHATGLLGAASRPEPRFEAAVWPPPGAEPVGLEGFYEALAATGYTYGPAFRGLTGAWRNGDELYAEVVLDPAHHDEAARFGLHPALLDAALHAGLAARGEDDGVRLPFSWNDVTLYAVGATALRARITPAGDGARLELSDAQGRPVASVGSLVSRPVDAARLDDDTRRVRESLFRLDWSAAAPVEAAAPHDWFVLGTDRLGVLDAFQGLGVFPQVFDDVAALGEAVAAGLPAPSVVVLPLGGEPGAGVDPAEAARTATSETLRTLQEWFGRPELESVRLAVVTRGAVATRTGEDVTDLPYAAARGLVRSAQAEQPGRIVLIDLDAADGAADEAAGRLPAAVAAALAADEPQAAVRDGDVLVPRLSRGRTSGDPLATPPGAPAWQLTAGSGGTLDGLALTPVAERPLAHGEIRVAVRAAGLNFRDVLIALGMYPGDAAMGNEGAGVVTEVSPGVDGLKVGDRVMGPFPGSFGPWTVTDRRLAVRVPDGWDFERAASVPTAFLTAYYGLVDLAGLRAGERVLVHAAAGGVGMAAVRIARHLGAEVFGTASEGKWDALRALGLDDDHIASSRDTSFAQKFPAMDVVLNSVSGDLVDASLSLLGEGGRFIEMGKTDVRDPQQVAATHPGVGYRAFDLAEAGPDRSAEILAALVRHFEAGDLAPLPVRAWDVRRAAEAFR